MTMGKYIKGTEEVEAIQFEGTPGSAAEILINSFEIPGSRFVPLGDLSRGYITIPSSSGVGTKSVVKGNYVVKMADGHFEVFSQTQFCHDFKPLPAGV